MKRKPAARKKIRQPAGRLPRAAKSRAAGATIALVSHEPAFREVLALIERARQRAFHIVNTELIDLYWRVGEFISRKLETAVWGQGVVAELAAYIQRHHPNLRGFTRASLFRMRQFFDTYRHDKKVAPLVRQLPWSSHLLILGRSKRSEEREFYIRLAIRERWPKRELERQLRGSLFERTILSPPKLSPAARVLHPSAAEVFKDAYLVEFLELASAHSEAVEYALARSVSPALIADYKTRLPDPALLRRKLHEFYALAAPAAEPKPTRAAPTKKSRHRRGAEAG